MSREGFEVTDSDLHFALGGKRKRMSKSSATYGVFGGDDSEDEGLSKRARRARGLGAASYDSDSSPDLDHEDDRPRGLGASSHRSRSNVGGGNNAFSIGSNSGVTAGISFVSGGQLNKPKPAQSDEKTSVSSSANDKKKETKKAKKNGSSAKSSSSGSSGKTKKLDYSWEKYTGGLGSRLLMKSGWKPSDSNSKQGAVIEVSGPRGTLGLGAAHGERGGDPVKKSKNANRKRDDTDDDSGSGSGSDDEEDGEEGEGQTMTLGGVKMKMKDALYFDLSGGAAVKKTASESGWKKPKKEYVSADAVNTAGFEPVKIIDRTRPSGPLPALRHNMRVLVEEVEREVSELELESKRASVGKLDLEKARDSARVAVTANRGRVETLETAHGAVDHLLKLQGADSGVFLEAFADLRSSHPQAWDAFQLARLALPVVGPVMGRELSSWAPLDEPDRAASALTPWRDVLLPATLEGVESEEAARRSEYSSGALTPHEVYELLIVETTSGPIQKALSSGWEVEQPEKVLVLLDSLVTLIPPSALQDLLDGAVLPRLVRTIQHWSPGTGAVPLDEVIHPWLVHFPRKSLERHWHSVRVKLRAELRGWDGVSSSGLDLLRPWKGLFSRRSMKRLVTDAALPKLIVAARSVKGSVPGVGSEIDEGDMAVVKSIVSWSELVSMSELGQIIAVEVIARRLAPVVADWISKGVTGSDLTALADWYVSWRALLSDELIQSSPALSGVLRSVLQLMRMTVEAPAGVASWQVLDVSGMDFSGRGSRRRGKGSEAGGDEAKKEPRRMIGNEMGMREVLEQAAEEHGVLFVPDRGGLEGHLGKTVWLLGGERIVWDGDLVYVHRQSHWVPIAVDDLLQG